MITDYLVEKSNGMLRTDFTIGIGEQIAEILGISIVEEVNDWTGKGYTMHDDGSAEVAVLEFLHYLLKLVKPQRVGETGTYHGMSAAYMALALKKNGFGHLETLEINPEFISIAKERWSKLQVAEWITVYQQSSMDFQPQGEYDFLFLDSEPEYRFKELVKFYPYLKEGGFVFIHDLHRHMSQHDNSEHGFGWPFGKLPDEIKQWVKEDKLRSFHFPTPRGLTGFYKVREDDYQWT